VASSRTLSRRQSTAKDSMRIKGGPLVAVCIAGGILLTVSFLVLTQVMEHQHDPHNLLTSAVDENVLGFEVLEPRGRAIWKVSSPQGSRLSRVEYGVVPDGFRQEVPPNGEPPRPLVSAERLRLRIVTPSWVFTHDGVAVDNSGFEGGVSTYTPRARVE
jgi:hypothetical protein